MAARKVPKRTVASDHNSRSFSPNEVFADRIDSDLFLRQSKRSNYCGIYSAGMLFSLLGYPTTRREALRLFGLRNSNPGYTGTTHHRMGKVIAVRLGAPGWRWRYYRQFYFRSVVRSMFTHFTNTRRPTLISFGAIHKNGVWRCRHTAVVVGATDECIDLLDPLGAPPADRNAANVYLRLNRSIFVVGNSYSVQTKAEVGILHWK